MTTETVPTNVLDTIDNALYALLDGVDVPETRVAGAIDLLYAFDAVNCHEALVALREHRGGAHVQAL